MNKIVLALVAGAACGMAQAGTIVMSQSVYGTAASGEFNATPSGLGFSPLALNNAGYFETFCLEKNEYFNYGQAYNVVIGTAADAGGVAGQVGSTDPLDDRTAYLYYAFITGGLTGYDYSNGLGQRQANGIALQNAIWFLENEVGTLDSADAMMQAARSSPSSSRSRPPARSPVSRSLVRSPLAVAAPDRFRDKHNT